jgi:hypothetical protein
VKRQHLTLAAIFGLLVAASLACAELGGTSSADATAQALAQSIEETATAAAGESFDAEANLQTAQAQATLDSLDAAATQAAAAAGDEQDAAATAAAAAPIIAELPTYGVDPSEGELAWIHPPVSIDVEGYLQYDYINHFIGTLVSDYVVSSDITWNTDTGLAGCGYVLRSDGNEEAINQYMVIASRGGAGTVFFVTVTEGEFLHELNFATDADPQFEWQNDFTNRLTVVARGNSFTIFTNGTQIAQVTDDTYTRGFVAMVALSESQQTHCEFNNTWLWSLD